MYYSVTYAIVFPSAIKQLKIMVYFYVLIKHNYLMWHLPYTNSSSVFIFRYIVRSITLYIESSWSEFHSYIFNSLPSQQRGINTFKGLLILFNNIWKPEKHYGRWLCELRENADNRLEYAKFHFHNKWK